MSYIFHNSNLIIGYELDISITSKALREHFSFFAYFLSSQVHTFKYEFFNFILFQINAKIQNFKENYGKAGPSFLYIEHLRKKSTRRSETFYYEYEVKTMFIYK